MEPKKEYRNSRSSAESEFNLGKLPPQAVEEETAVLGFFMMQKDILSENIDFIKPEFFYKEAHQIIFTAISNLFYKNESVDKITVTSELKRMEKFEEVGGIMYLLQLTEKLGYAPTTEKHIRIITERFIQREIIKASSNLIIDCYDNSNDVFDTIKRFDEFNSKINQYIIGKDYESEYSKLVDAAYHEIINQAKVGFSGIDTGSDKLNAITGGWSATDFIIMCARPGVGKSTRMINFVKKASMQGKKCAIFSLEMSATQLIKKQLIEQSNVFANKILNADLNDFDLQRIKESYYVIKDFKIYLNEKTTITPNYIRQVCRERKKKYGLDMIFIDYLQLMKGNAGVKYFNKEQEIASIATALKNLAKELKIPVMALCQLNRDGEKRGDKRPVKSDLRDSGQLEQDADLILSLYRPSVYWDCQNDPDYKNLDEETHNRISELGILKNRHGKSEVYFEERFYGELSRFDTNIMEV